jgi:hypothetical protein
MPPAELEELVEVPEVPLVPLVPPVANGLAFTAPLVAAGLIVFKIVGKVKFANTLCDIVVPPEILKQS